MRFLEGQIYLGITCTQCREQYAAAQRTDVPCDVGKCKYTPSPGDTGEKGCGLLPANELAVWLYPRWKAFGDAVFNMVNVEMMPSSAETLLEKLYIIHQYAPAIQEAQERRSNHGNTKNRRRRNNRV